MESRKRLTDILNGTADNLKRAWDTTIPAEEFGPLPRGEYVTRIVSGEFFASRANKTPGYKICHRVLDGEFADRKFWHDIWLTETALPMAKRDLRKIGVTNLDQLDGPLPQGIRCKVKLALRKEDDGSEHNRVTFFEVIGVELPEADPFAPAPAGEEVTR